jgi:uncharacterized membrane protein YhiD involved in acid resistance
MLSKAATTRLLAACAMGGAVGIEREWRHKDSGLRTNMLICMGSALFTIMSVVLAGTRRRTMDRWRRILCRGGFLGAGLILHTKNRVLGLTSAATVFVVAAIGMTCGAGLYIEALIARCWCWLRCNWWAWWRASWGGSAIRWCMRCARMWARCCRVRGGARRARGAG